MRQVLQVIFLFFYAASTYAIGQERTSFFVSELVHSASTGTESAARGGCSQLDAGWPNYREAKPRAISVSEGGDYQDFQFQPNFTESFFLPQSSLLKPLYSFEQALDRAPPER